MGHIRDLRLRKQPYNGPKPYQARVHAGNRRKEKSFKTPEDAQAWIDWMESTVLFNPNGSYDDIVIRGRLLAKKHYSVNWEVGDLLLELVPLGTRGDQSRNVGEIIKQWIIDVDSPWSFQTLLKHRETAHHWPKDKREPEAPFTAHKLLANHKDRFEIMRPGLTIREAHRILGRKYKEPSSPTKNSSVYDKTRAMMSFASSALSQMRNAADADIEFAESIQENIDTTRFILDELEEELFGSNDFMEVA